MGPEWLDSFTVLRLPVEGRGTSISALSRLPSAIPRVCMLTRDLLHAKALWDYAAQDESELNMVCNADTS